VHTARAVAGLAQKLAVEMPITRAVCRVLGDSRQARAAVQELLAREQKAEY
jgi:glycerol-3-phosphate dehydrogenase (NAD(P)+)